MIGEGVVDGVHINHDESEKNGREMVLWSASPKKKRKNHLTEKKRNKGHRRVFARFRSGI